MDLTMRNTATIPAKKMTRTHTAHLSLAMDLSERKSLSDRAMRGNSKLAMFKLRGRLKQRGRREPRKESFEHS